MINTNIKKLYQQTAGLIQRLTNISHLLLIGVIVAEKFCLTKYMFVVYKFVLHGKQFVAKHTWKTICCQTDKRSEMLINLWINSAVCWYCFLMLVLIIVRISYSGIDYISGPELARYAEGRWLPNRMVY